MECAYQERRRTLKRALLAAAILVAIITVFTSSVFAAPFSGVLVEVKKPTSGRTESWALGLQYAKDNDAMASFDTSQYNSNQSWVAMWSGQIGSNTPYSVGAYYPYSGMKCYQFMAWNGTNVQGDYADVYISILDSTLEKTWNILWQDERGQYQEKYLMGGQSWSFQMWVPKLASPDQWEQGGLIEVSAMTPFATPEPGSILTLGSGIIGLAGAAIRRRR